MGRFHVCMPVAADQGFYCFVCERDMRAEMSEYSLEPEERQQVTVVVTAGRDRTRRTPGWTHDAGRHAGLGVR